MKDTIEKLKTRYRFFTYWQDTSPQIVKPQLLAIEKKLLELGIIAYTYLAPGAGDYIIKFKDAPNIL